MQRNLIKNVATQSSHTDHLTEAALQDNKHLGSEKVTSQMIFKYSG